MCRYHDTMFTSDVQTSWHNVHIRCADTMTKCSHKMCRYHDTMFTSDVQTMIKYSHQMCRQRDTMFTSDVQIPWHNVHIRCADTMIQCSNQMCRYHDTIFTSDVQTAWHNVHTNTWCYQTLLSCYSPIGACVALLLRFLYQTQLDTHKHIQ
jgi:hypothetical protein